MLFRSPEEERPRERLWKHGADKLKTEELIAILLRTGMKGKSAVALAAEMLAENGNSLNTLAKLEQASLAGKKGVGRIKAIQLKAAFELARRMMEEKLSREPITEPKDAVARVREEFRFEDREVFRVLLLDTKSRLIRLSKVSVGTVNASLVEPREVFKEAITHSATSIILAHNFREEVGFDEVVEDVLDAPDDAISQLLEKWGAVKAAVPSA